MQVLATLVPRLGLPCEMARVTLSKREASVSMPRSVCMVGERRCNRLNSNNTGPDRLPRSCCCTADESVVLWTQLMQAYTSGWDGQKRTCAAVLMFGANAAACRLVLDFITWEVSRRKAEDEYCCCCCCC